MGGRVDVVGVFFWQPALGQRTSQHHYLELNNGYRAMAADKVREDEAKEWCNALANDVANATR